MEPPLRQSLLQQVSQPTRAWRILVDEQITKQQPFHLLYRNAQGQELTFTVRYAEICFHEKRFYLLIWCEETADVEQDIPDLPELWHNRCLRLDRIQEMSVVPIGGRWKGELDFIKVQLHFRRGLVKAYESKPDDIDDAIVGDVRQITRRVANAFWLIREVSQYWEHCEIVAPEALRDRFKQKLRTLGNIYNITATEETQQ